MAELVPKVTSLAEIYGDSASDPASTHHSRLQEMVSKFKETFHNAPDFVARSPGRVNVIGEHIDYSLFDVLPMAVTADCLIAVKATSSTDDRAIITVANLDSERFPTSSFTVRTGQDIEIDATKHEWTNYFKAGFKGAISYLRQHQQVTALRSMQVLAHGNVPPGGGLSSSAALVCASALATMSAHDHHVSKQDLLDLAVVSERAVGVYSGGMDQAASIFAQQNFLLGCLFYPSFRAEQVAVPVSEPEATFLIAQSFVTADKHVTAPKHYNLRVVECTLTAVVLAKLCAVVLKPDSSSLGFSLKNAQEQIMAKEGMSSQPPKDQLGGMLAIVRSKLTEKFGYSREDLASVLGLSVAELEKQYMSKFPVEAEQFQLRNRAIHVFSEAGRVLDFKSVLSRAADSGDALQDSDLKILGDLMNATQKSCSQIYECSCPELDQICGIARRAGSYGSRLTGAGWGGCTVHLVAQNRVEAVKKALVEEYYKKRFPDMTDEKLREALVISKPSSGAAVIVGDVLKE